LERLLPAAAATTAAIASATATAPRATASAFCLRTSFIHIQRSAPVLGSVQSGDCFVALFGVRHLDEPEAARSAGITIGKDRNPVDLSILLKQLAQLIFPSVEAEIPNEDVLHAYASVLELFESGCLRRERE
jgi:hypothetical protein